MNPPNMPSIQPLNPLTTPLDQINLIEASAGTGKTFTIALLFLRLVLEKKLTVDRILVVTFTEAATKELRDRIRKRLRECLLAFQQGASDDDKLQALLDKPTIEHEDALFRLTNALRGFDEAAIYTIHSFCRRVLRDNAFESGMLFDTELIKDQRPLLQEIVEDFWRRHFYQASPLFINYLLDNGFRAPANLLETLGGDGKYLGQPFLKVIPQVEETQPQSAALEQAFLTAHTAAQQCWQQEQERIVTRLSQDKNLNRQKYRASSIVKWRTELTINLNSPAFAAHALDILEKFTVSKLAASTKKGKNKQPLPPPEHPFFQLAETLLTAQVELGACFAQQLLALRLKLLEVAKQHLAAKKRRHNVQSFDDLLTGLFKGLNSDNGQRLAALIRSQYPAALIDEFQDTDPVQYDIFKKIYATDKHLLFLIGDPKQAIYSFRGADIFAYMKACTSASRHFTLDTNWRSEPRLIQAMNSVFSQTPQPFLFEQIPFYPVNAPPNAAEKPCLTLQNQSIPPLQCWFVSRAQASATQGTLQAANNKKDDQLGLINKNWAEFWIPRAVGYEITRLLQLAQQGLAAVGEQPLVAGDIAILVRTNRQALQLQKVLNQLQIPSVLYSRESLFSTHEAAELERILLAIADPSREALLKAALTTDMFGISGSQLFALLADDYAWQEKLKRVQHYHRLWQKKGFIQMFRALLVEENMQARLLAFTDGERRLTNVLHLGEVLQQAALREKLGINALHTWLSEQRQQAAAEQGDDERILRLESDEKRVKIVTIHKSKGLEYPVVFCPYVWESNLSWLTKATEFTYHDEHNDLVLDLGSADQPAHLEQAKRELLAENLRLFYVAVTRAKYRCYLIWGAFKGFNDAPLAHLLYPAGAELAKFADTELHGHLQKLANAAAHSIEIIDFPMQVASAYQSSHPPAIDFSVRTFHATVQRDWQVASFTRLAHQKTAYTTVENPDYDPASRTLLSPTEPILWQDDAPPEAQRIFEFPRGAKAGRFLHAVFEYLDFPQGEDDALLQRLLRYYNYDADAWQATLRYWVAEVLNTPLHADDPGFTLAKIDKAKRLNELEFYYPLQPISVAHLQTLFQTHTALLSPELLEFSETRLQFSPLQGFMKGFIDMVFEYQGRFYLVDYKSNLLGKQLTAYHQSQLSVVMQNEAYFLQAALYTVALHLYLARRLPAYDYEQHFGGVYYLFIRGMRSAWGAAYGVYRDKPPQAWVQALTECLTGYRV